jgi:hypothetical protein
MKAKFARLTMALAMACGALTSAQAEQLRANFNVSIIGLPIGTAFAVAKLDPNAYKIDVRVKLTGVAAMVNKTEGAATGSGALANGAVLSNAYANTTANSTETRTVRMGLNAGNVRAVDISPPFLDMGQRVPVTDAHKSGIVDPISALLMPVPAGQPLIGASACNRVIPVYDGLVRFNVTLRHVGEKTIQTKGYSGPVSVCAARYTPVAGYKPDSKSTQWMANNKNMEVWLAPLENAHVVAPVYVSIATSAGTLNIRANEFLITP